jgi:hypothetical protein
MKTLRIKILLEKYKIFKGLKVTIYFEISQYDIGKTINKSINIFPTGSPQNPYLLVNKIQHNNVINWKKTAYTDGQNVFCII